MEGKLYDGHLPGERVWVLGEYAFGLVESVEAGGGIIVRLDDGDEVVHAAPQQCERLLPIDFEAGR